MARVIQYEELALAIEPDGPDSYRVKVLGSPYGLTAAPFALPFSRHELAVMLAEIREGLFQDRAARGASRAHGRRPGHVFQETGARLFRALFDGAVREIYLLSKGRSESTPDRGLRIRLVLPAAGDDAALLQALPWELLYCEQTRDFLATNALTPVVRQLDIPWASASFGTAAERVRILIAVATPSGFDLLDGAKERACILEAWCRQQGAEVELLSPPTLTELREQLRSRHFQVVHFIGHGVFDDQAGVGSLVFETASGGPHAVPGSIVAATLRESRELRLVFLNACQSAQLGHGPDHDPLLGVASALVHRGVPAVIAMQFPISDEAAKVFSEAVYRSLARGSALDEAVGDGRMAVRQAAPSSWEWITPAVLTALPGPEPFRRLGSPPEFDPPEPVHPPGTPPTPPSPPPPSGPDVTIARATQLLSTHSYERARHALEACLAEVSDRSDLHYYLALALLGDRRPRFLKGAELKPIEASANQVLHLADCAAHHLCFLAFLRKDFYLENYLVPPAPGYEALLRRAAAAPRQPAKLAELVELVPWAKPVVAQVEEQARSDSP